MSCLFLYFQLVILQHWLIKANYDKINNVIIFKSPLKLKSLNPSFIHDKQDFLKNRIPPHTHVLFKNNSLVETEPTVFTNNELGSIDYVYKYPINRNEKQLVILMQVLNQIKIIVFQFNFKIQNPQVNININDAFLRFEGNNFPFGIDISTTYIEDKTIVNLSQSQSTEFDYKQINTQIAYLLKRAKKYSVINFNIQLITLIATLLGCVYIGCCIYTYYNKIYYKKKFKQFIHEL